ncbi:hypothetical protein K449DRAFT_429141 [Hypoxylon sp. EC38]|nr:hypothetical protein K449DRAFT_429141 [Hypoxylon sp. EC38]
MDPNPNPDAPNNDDEDQALLAANLLGGPNGFPESWSQEDIFEYRTSMLNLFRGWYNVQDIQPDYSYEMYEPQGRYVPVLVQPEKFERDWYHENGIPHEILTPILGEYDEEGRQKTTWFPFKLWMRIVARAWWKSPPQNSLNPELFDGLYDRGSINFFRVMKSRIARQRQYAFYTRLLNERLTTVFDPPPPGDAAAHLSYRREHIIFSLMGLDDENILYDSIKMDELLRFIRSPAVKGAFLEYYQNWLQHNPATQNPRWGFIQSAFADRSRDAQRRITYGTGRLVERSPINKAGWIHEDHAMRFLIVLYSLGRAHMSLNNIEAGDARAGWRRYMFSDYSYVDFEDKYWFGFALLNLLIKSWQYNIVYPHPDYDTLMVPALYMSFELGPLGIELPKPNVGFIDMSPSSPWTTSDVNYEPSIDFTVSNSFGLTHPVDIEDLWQSESETELDEDGGEIATPLKIQQKKMSKKGQKGVKKGQKGNHTGQTEGVKKG